MIYYFSGTGNSRWVAEELARRTNDEARSISALTQDGPTAVYAAGDSRIGIVFPVYAWGAPKIVERFCRSITVEQGAYAFAVCTCGDEAGRAMRRLKKRFPWQSAWSLAMPNNYIVGFDVDSLESVRRKIKDAREKLPQIADAILAGAAGYDVCEGPAAWLKTALLCPMFNAAMRRTKPFFATDDCNSCGLCVHICPTQAIQLEEGKPLWVKKHCAQCMGCINRCPAKAIQYGAGTALRGRYYYRDAE